MNRFTLLILLILFLMLLVACLSNIIGVCYHNPTLPYC